LDVIQHGETCLTVLTGEGFSGSRTLLIRRKPVRKLAVAPANGVAEVQLPAGERIADNREMTKADVQEALVTLYLRLNGYFTTGFIVQSSTPGRVTTELDILAVRLPHNAEPDRVIGCAPELDTWDSGIDFIIGEVKSRDQPLQFNSAVRNPQAVSTILQWWGYLTAEEVATKTQDVLSILQPLPGAVAAPTVLCPRGARVRSILFSPETRSIRRPQQAWFISGPPMFKHIFACLHPSELRATCATDYGAGQWGIGLERFVSYFKDAARTVPSDFGELVAYLGVKDE
jgi:hypothetical protein